VEGVRKADRGPNGVLKKNREFRVDELHQQKSTSPHHEWRAPVESLGRWDNVGPKAEQKKLVIMENCKECRQGEGGSGESA